MSPFNRPNPATEPRRPWVSPVLKMVGTIADILQCGGGKGSVVTDSGDGRKPDVPHN
jgi:hypothetical protein